MWTSYAPGSKIAALPIKGKWVTRLLNSDSDRPGGSSWPRLLHTYLPVTTPIATANGGIDKCPRLLGPPP